jgi:hypothetical protein
LREKFDKLMIRKNRGGKEMKKLRLLFFIGILCFALGTPGYAQAPRLEFKASGFIDTQTFLYMNAPQRNTSAGIYRTLADNRNLVGFTGAPFFAPTEGLNRTASFWDARAHLKFDAIMGTGLSGTIFLEIDTYRYGSPWTTGIGLGREANNFGGWTTDRAAVEVKNVYIDVGLPYFGIPVPITVRVGAQPIGVRPHITVYSDGTGVTAGLKIDPVLIAPIYAKMLEANDFQDDDCDVWGLHVNAKINTFTIGGYGLYYRMNSYPLWVNQPTGITGFPAALTPAAPGSDKAKMWWLGAYVDGKAGPVNINFDFVYDFGKVSRGPNMRTPWVPHVKYEGWATRAKIDYPWDKFNFGMVAMYATGADARRTSTSGLPGSTTSIGTLSSKVSSYVVPPGSEQDSANNESIVVYGMDSGTAGAVGIAKNANYAQMCRGGFGGTWFAKLYGSVRATSWYKITVQGLYVGDTTKHGDTLGNSVRPGSTLLRDNKDIGWELDVINDFQIYNNLRFTLGAGYLWAGDAVDLRRGTTLTNFSPKNPWAVRTRLIYTF